MKSGGDREPAPAKTDTRHRLRPDPDDSPTHTVKPQSGAERAALYLLRTKELAPDYAAAWDEWDCDDDAVAWEDSVIDGLPP